MITKQDVIEYFEAWSSNSEDQESKMNFIMMLQAKATFSGANKQEIFAGGDMRTSADLDEMLCIADDLFLINNK